jgi:hypothetical protein
MGEKVNVVVAIPFAAASKVDIERATSELASRLLGAGPQTWIAIRGMETSNHQWPPATGEIGRRLREGEIVAAYPRHPAGSAAGAVVWSGGSQAMTASVAIPIELAPTKAREALARVALEICHEGALCAIGSELELSGDDKDSLAPIEVAKRRDVELVGYLGVTGEVDIA